MTKLLWLGVRSVPLAAIALWAVVVAGLLCSAACAQQSAASNGKSWTDTVVSPLTQGFEKLGRALTPKSTPPAFGPEDDAISLKGKADPGPELYVAVARLYERSGNADDAEKKYQLALKEKPDYLPALLGYAHLKQRIGKPDEAVSIYKRAVNAHPREGSVHNNLGLCYAMQNQLDDAVAAISHATQLEPKNPLYRNNIATVLIDQGKPREAFSHLREVHQTATAYYNMGYLLNKKGQTQASLQNFSQALRADPSMTVARRWVEHLQKTTTQARLPNKITSEPKSPLDNAPMPPDQSPPRRLPPTSLDQSDAVGPALPGISQKRFTAPLAPLPPVTTDTVLRPLPRVK